MVKVLPVRTLGPASTRTPLDPLELGFPSHGESCSSLSSPECRRSSEQAGRQPSHPAPAEAAVPRPAISFSFSCPLRPSRRPLASLPRGPCPPLLAAPPGARGRRGCTCPGAAAALGMLHGMGGEASLRPEARDSVSGWV